MRFSSDHSSKRRLSLSTIDSADTSDQIPLKAQDRQYQQQEQLQLEQEVQSHPAKMDTSYPPKRRPQLVRVPTTPTRYMEMLLHLDKISPAYNILAAASTWIILAAFLVIPGSYTSFKNTSAFQNADDSDKDDIAHAILHSAAHIGLVWVSAIFAILGAFGCTFLWFRWRYNYVWLVNRIFMPALLNSVAGLLTTVVNVYTAQKGVWSITAKITAIVTGSSIFVSGILFAVYTVLLDKVKARHQRELDAAYRSGLETLGSKVFGRKAAKKSVHDPMVVV